MLSSSEVTQGGIVTAILDMSTRVAPGVGRSRSVGAVGLGAKPPDITGGEIFLNTESLKARVSLDQVSQRLLQVVSIFMTKTGIIY